MNTPLFPVPVKADFSRTGRDLTSVEWIVLPPDAGFPLKNRILELAKRLSGSFQHTLRVCAGEPSSASKLLVMTRHSSIAPEGYRIRLGTSGPIALEAGDDAGFFYGMQTVLQLLRDPARVSCCRIDDAPSMKERGYMLDVSRDKIPTMETMRSLVKSLSLLRYNSLQLYMEHTFAFAAHERVWSGYTPFTPEEIMELDAFCRDHFIELVPNLNSFGHLQKWLMHEEYDLLAEVKGGNVLRPCRAAVDFMDRLYAEFLPNFTSRKVNIGCDETAQLGKGKSAALCRKRGVTQVYLDFLTKLADRAEKRGFSVEFWGDIILHQPDLISKLPKGITALEWGYEADHPFRRDTALFRKAGVDFLVCPGTSAWLSLLGRTSNMIGNISNAMQYGCRNHARGMLMTDWGDGGHHQYYPVSWPGIVMGGGASWNAVSKETAERIPAGVAFAFAPETDGVRLGEFLLEAGNVYEDYVQKTSNGTPFARAMMFFPNARPEDFAWLKNITKSDAEKAIRHTKDLLACLRKKPFPHAPVVHAELENGLRMALLGHALLLRAAGGPFDQTWWRKETARAVDSHETLWLIRNRSGGLHHSSSVLRKLADFDPDAWCAGSRS